VESSTVDHSERGRGESRHDSLSLEPRTERSRPRHRGVVMAKMLFAGDLIAALLAATAALVILDNPVPDSPLFVVAVALLWPLVAFSIGLYRADQLSSWASAVPEIPRGVVAIMLMTWPIFGLTALMGIDPAIGTAFVTVGAMAVFAGVARTLVRATLHRNPDLRQRTLILGSGVVAGQVVEKIRTNQQFGLDPVGLVDNVVHDIGTPDLPRFGGFTDLGKIIEMQSIDRVIIAFSRVSHEELLEAIRACRDAGVAVDVVPRLFEFLDGVRSLDQIGGLPLISIGVPGLASTMVAAKRMLDVLGSAALLAIFSPVLITTAIAVKIESKGPVFFLQPRAGRGNKSFNLIKFRSMYVDAEQRKADLDAMNESDDGGDVQDPRRPPHHPGRRLHPPLLDRRAAAALQRPQGRDEPGRAAAADLQRDRRPGRALAPAPARAASRDDRPVAGLRPLRQPLPGDGPLRLPIRGRLGPWRATSSFFSRRFQRSPREEARIERSRRGPATPGAARRRGLRRRRPRDDRDAGRGRSRRRR